MGAFVLPCYDPTEYKILAWKIVFAVLKVLNLIYIPL